MFLVWVIIRVRIPGSVINKIMSSLFSQHQFVRPSLKLYFRGHSSSYESFRTIEITSDLTRPSDFSLKPRDVSAHSGPTRFLKVPQLKSCFQCFLKKINESATFFQISSDKLFIENQIKL